MTGGVFDNGTGNSVYLAGTWEWDGATWIQLTPSLDPPAVFGEQVVYDEARQRAVRIQGLTDRVFEWDGTDWFQRTVAGSKPQSRYFPAVAYDNARRRIVSFGGRSFLNPFGPVGETWSYAPTQPADLPAFGAGCSGSAGVPNLSSAELPWVGESMDWHIANLPPMAPVLLLVGASRSSYAGVQLPLSLAFVNAPGCELLVSPHIGVGLTAVGGVASWSLSLPNVAALVGQSFFLQGVVADAGANAFGFAFSNAVAATIGSK